MFLIFGSCRGHPEPACTDRELPSLAHLTSLETLSLYEAWEYLNNESLQMYSQINLILPVSLKEIRFAFDRGLVDEGAREGWRQTDDALCDPELKNLRLVGVSHLNPDNSFPLEYMPKCLERGVLRRDGRDKRK